MLIRRAERFTSAEITDEKLYLRRREFIAGTAAVMLAGCQVDAAPTPAQGAPLPATRNDTLSVKDPVTKWESATTYNNF